MLLWVCGSIAAIAGTLVYIEFGLTTPRYLFGRTKRSVPRNGGELHYVGPYFQTSTEAYEAYMRPAQRYF